MEMGTSYDSNKNTKIVIVQASFDSTTSHPDPAVVNAPLVSFGVGPPDNLFLPNPRAEEIEPQRGEFA